MLLVRVDHETLHHAPAKTETASSHIMFFPWKTALLIFHLETHGALPGSKHHLE
jgi:hypothetical protein